MHRPLPLAAVAAAVLLALLSALVPSTHATVQVSAITLGQVTAAKQNKDAAEAKANQAMQARMNAQTDLDNAKQQQTTAQAQLAAALAADKKASDAKAKAQAASALCKSKNLTPAQKNLAAKQAAGKTAQTNLDNANKALAAAKGAKKDSKYQANVNKAQANVNTAQANLNKANQDLNKATAAYASTKATCDSIDNDAQAKAAAADQSKQNVKTCQDNVAAAGFKVTQADATLKQKQNEETKCNDAYAVALKSYNNAYATFSTTSGVSISSSSETSGGSTTILWNDDKYPTVGQNDCTDPSAVTCTETCSSNSGKGGRYVLPNGGRCKDVNKVNPSINCKYNSISLSECCNLCRNTSTCSFFQHYVPPSPSCSGCGVCFTYSPGSSPQCATTKCAGGRLCANASTIGKPCPYTKHDPHFRGAHGTRFEFNGAPEKSYCLITDRDLHVNMKMRGYYDTRTIGASLLRNGLAVRTWIREMGFVWRGADGVEHSFRLASRNGKSDKRDNGFLALIEYDGRVLPPLEPGESYQLDGGLVFAFNGYETEGGGFFDVDAYSLRIGNKLAMDVKLRAAHPLLQTPDDAQVHLNVNFRHLARTTDIHGIMGQTYREGRDKRALDYSALSRLLHAPFSADADNGAGFLDGKASDYQTSSVLSTDCGFTSFHKSQ
eukprot:TRINITY_DN805_c0_g1_i1.p1 TRINITY_DN805_c0_g1~~TRINITY_DN805_c0_g1_i1.p1  ORF type:complete len:665 (+),score=63.66 TRINITY_DN805_c0_g1_i1:220-2214(+)